MINFRKIICYTKGIPGWLYNLCDCKRYEVKMNVCKKTGLLHNPYCELEEKVFLKGQTPTDRCEECVEPEPEYNICQFPVNEINKIIGWSHGYENAVRYYKGENFNAELWEQMADEIAKYVNSIRFFAYCTEGPEWLRTTYVPFPKVGNKYDCSRLAEDYIEEVGSRLESYHKRKLTTIICLFTSIKGRRWPSCPLNGNLNINGTVTNHKNFMSDEKTLQVQKQFIRNMVKQFDNEYIHWEFINEPAAFKAGVQDKWFRRLVSFIHNLGVPYERIQLGASGIGSKIYYFLDLGIWNADHARNSYKSVWKYHQSFDRWCKREAIPGCDCEPNCDYHRRRGYGSGDGGDEFGESKGLKIWQGKYQKASSAQMFSMLYFDLNNGALSGKGKLKSGNGIEFMSSSAFCLPDENDEFEYYTNLRQSLRIATEGLTRSECQKMGVDYEENKRPELKQIYKAYEQSLPLKD